MTSTRLRITGTLLAVLALVSVLLTPLPARATTQTTEQFRALDTRAGAKPADGSTVCTTIAGRGGVRDDVVSVEVYLVAVQADAPGFVAAFAAGADVPPTSVLNYDVSPRSASSSAIVAVGEAGQICFGLLTSAHLVIDVARAFYGDTHRPVDPFRAADTRTGGLPGAESTTCIVVAGVGGVPAEAAAVSLNIAVTQADEPGFVTLFPKGTPASSTSNLNFDIDETVNNGAVVAVGENGEICVYSHRAAHHIVDVDGWFPSDSTLRALATPQRILDSRTTVRPAARSTTCLNVVGNGIPATAESVFATVTAVRPDGPGFVTAYAAGRTRPDVSALNYDTGVVRSTGGLVPVGERGEICLYTLDATDLVVDLSAYQVPVRASEDVAFSQFRALDSRSGPQPEDGSVRCVNVVEGRLQADVVAVAVNIAALDQTGSGFVKLFPAGSPPPETTAVNFASAQGIASSNTVVEVGNQGEICAFLSTSAHIVIDVHGAYYADTYVPAQPTFRARDTRTEGRPPQGSTTCTKVAGVGGVPVDAGSVSVNVAGLESDESGFLAVFASGTERPPTSNLNFDAGEVVNNGAVVAVGEGGEICVYSHSAAHHILDVNGWFPDQSTVQALPVPRRLLDTRVTSRPTANSTICLAVVGDGVPVNAVSVQLNVTAVRPDSPGFVAMHPSGTSLPQVSSLNYGTGTVRASGGMVPTGRDGKVCVHTTAATDLVVDLMAYQARADDTAESGMVLRRQPSGRVGTCNGYDELISTEDVSWWDWISSIESRGLANLDGTDVALFEVEAYHRIEKFERCEADAYVFEWVGNSVSHLERCAAMSAPVRVSPSRLSDVQWAGEAWSIRSADSDPCTSGTDPLDLLPGDPVDAGDPDATTPIDPAAAALRRLAGAGRQQTSVVVAGHAFPDGADTVIIAEESAGLPAALAAGATTIGPVLLTGGSMDPLAEVLDAITALGVEQIVAIGSADGGVSDAVIDEMARGRPASRIDGADPYETSANIAGAGWPDGASTVYLVESLQLADGLAGGTLVEGPILLVPEDGEVPTTTLEAIATLDPERIVALGGVHAVADPILEQAAGDRPFERVEGPSRFETAVAVSNVAFPDGATTVYLARADIAPDSVVAGTVSDGPILLVESCNGVHPATRAEIERLGATEIIGLGGPDAVCDETLLAAQPSTPASAGR